MIYCQRLNGSINESQVGLASLRLFKITSLAFLERDWTARGSRGQTRTVEGGGSKQTELVKVAEILICSEISV